MSTQQSTSTAEVTSGTGQESVEYALIGEEDGATECVLYPIECDDEALMTEWIAAKEGSYVSLDDIR